MKRILLSLLLSSSCFFIGFSQQNKSGKILYEREMTAHIIMNGETTEKKQTADYEILFNSLSAKLQKVQDANTNATEESAGMVVRDGDKNRKIFFDLPTNKITESLNFNGEDLLILTSLGAESRNAVKSDETRTIAGYVCRKATVTTANGTTTIWYTNDLKLNVSPLPSIWSEGTVLGLENKNTSFYAKSVQFQDIDENELKMTAKGTAVTMDEFKKKVEERNAKNGNGPVRIVQ